MELENEKIKYLQAEQNLKNLNISISQLEEGINNISKTKSGVVINNEKDKINYSSQTIQLLEQLRKSLKQWEQNYLLISSTNGTVSFQQFFGENQFIKSGDAIVSVIPKDKVAVVGRMYIPSANNQSFVGSERPTMKLLLNGSFGSFFNTMGLS